MTRCGCTMKESSFNYCTETEIELFDCCRILFKDCGLESKPLSSKQESLNSFIFPLPDIYYLKYKSTFWRVKFRSQHFVPIEALSVLKVYFHGGLSWRLLCLIFSLLLFRHQWWLIIRFIQCSLIFVSYFWFVKVGYLVLLIFKFFYDCYLPKRCILQCELFGLY